MPRHRPGLYKAHLWILLLCLQAWAPWAGAADVAAGKAAFAKCASCHQVGPSARAGFGPQLNALFGRTAGSTADYAYSSAMKNSGIVWSDTTLAAFLKAPGDVVPGNRMRFYGLGNERQIADLLAYLRSFEGE